MPALLKQLTLALIGSLGISGAVAQSVDWPDYGPERDALRLEGFTNAVPDVVGPLDGSARLTIFTEGNHYPVFLPLVFEAFPTWCVRTQRCDVRADEIMVVTLPQVMIVEALIEGGLQFGNAVVPLSRAGAVYPDVVIAGKGPLDRLASEGIVGPSATVFAKHKGMGLLVKADSGVASLDDLSRSGGQIVIATPKEAGARRQYEATLDALLGDTRRANILERSVETWPGRLGIQHRDVPYALLNGHAEGGILFGHLAAFYAATYPEELAFVEVPEAAPFGQEIAVALTRRNRDVAGAFEVFLLEAAREAYPAGGFAGSESFGFSDRLDLSAN